jgi:hypothetical protein
MRAFSLQQSHRSLPNMFVQSWRRWMTRRADQLLETARLGSGNIEYLTHNPKATDSELCLVASGHADDLLRRRMLALDLDPYELAEALRAVPEPRRLCVGSGAGIGGSRLARPRRLARLL